MLDLLLVGLTGSMVFVGVMAGFYGYTKFRSKDVDLKCKLETLDLKNEVDQN